MYGYRVIFIDTRQSVLKKMYATSSTKFDTMDKAYKYAIDLYSRSAQIEIECIIVFKEKLIRYTEQLKNLED